MVGNFLKDGLGDEYIDNYNSLWTAIISLDGEGIIKSSKGVLIGGLTGLENVVNVAPFSFMLGSINYIGSIVEDTTGISVMQYLPTSSGLRYLKNLKDIIRAENSCEFCDAVISSILEEVFGKPRGQIEKAISNRIDKNIRNKVWNDIEKNMNKHQKEKFDKMNTKQKHKYKNNKIDKTLNRLVKIKSDKRKEKNKKSISGRAKNRISSAKKKISTAKKDLNKINMCTGVKKKVTKVCLQKTLAMPKLAAMCPVIAHVIHIECTQALGSALNEIGILDAMKKAVCEKAAIKTPYFDVGPFCKKGQLAKSCFSDICPLMFDIGDSCKMSLECKSGLCENGICVRCDEKTFGCTTLRKDEKCLRDEQCISGSCKDGKCDCIYGICSPLKYGEECNDHNECISGHCAKTKENSDKKTCVFCYGNECPDDVQDGKSKTVLKHISTDSEIQDRKPYYTHDNHILDPNDVFDPFIKGDVEKHCQGRCTNEYNLEVKDCSKCFDCNKNNDCISGKCINKMCKSYNQTKCMEKGFFWKKFGNDFKCVDSYNLEQGTKNKDCNDKTKKTSICKEYTKTKCKGDGYFWNKFGKNFKNSTMYSECKNWRDDSNVLQNCNYEIKPTDSGKCICGSDRNVEVKKGDQRTIYKKDLNMTIQNPDYRNYNMTCNEICKNNQIIKIPDIENAKYLARNLGFKRFIKLKKAEKLGLFAKRNEGKEKVYFGMGLVDQINCYDQAGQIVYDRKTKKQCETNTNYKWGDKNIYRPSWRDVEDNFNKTKGDCVCDLDTDGDRFLGCRKKQENEAICKKYIIDTGNISNDFETKYATSCENFITNKLLKENKCYNGYGELVNDLTNENKCSNRKKCLSNNNYWKNDTCFNIKNQIISNLKSKDDCLKNNNQWISNLKDYHDEQNLCKTERINLYTGKGTRVSRLAKNCSEKNYHLILKDRYEKAKNNSFVFWNDSRERYNKKITIDNSPYGIKQESSIILLPLENYNFTFQITNKIISEPNKNDLVICIIKFRKPIFIPEDIHLFFNMSHYLNSDNAKKPDTFPIKPKIKVSFKKNNSSTYVSREAKFNLKEKSESVRDNIYNFVKIDFDKITNSDIKIEEIRLELNNNHSQRDSDYLFNWSSLKDIKLQINRGKHNQEKVVKHYIETMQQI